MCVPRSRFPFCGPVSRVFLRRQPRGRGQPGPDGDEQGEAEEDRALPAQGPPPQERLQRDGREEDPLALRARGTPGRLAEARRQPRRRSDRRLPERVQQRPGQDFRPYWIVFCPCQSPLWARQVRASVRACALVIRGSSRKNCLNVFVDDVAISSYGRVPL